MQKKIDESWFKRPEKIAESVSCGGIVVRFEDGHAWIALVREGGMPDAILPKGRLEPGESPEMAARREIAEEAGLTELELAGYLGNRERLNYLKTRWVKIYYFLYVTAQKEGQPTDDSHSYQCEWHRIDRLPGIFWPEQLQLILDNRGRIEAMAAAALYTSSRSRRRAG